MGLLLRCDQENHWESGTTRTLLTRTLYAHEAHTRMKLEDLLVPSQQAVVLLAGWLGLPLGTIVAATYLRELRRFFGSATSVAGGLCFWSVFHLCPLCIHEQRVLLRCQFLIGMSSCLHHQVVLVACCACSAPQTFSRDNGAIYLLGVSKGVGNARPCSGSTSRSRKGAADTRLL